MQATGSDTTALLVIDMQCGAFDGVRCSPIAHADALLANAGHLLAAARAGGVPVVFIRHCEGAGEPFEDGTPHGQLHAALQPLPGEPVVDKRASSAFDGTALASVLQGLQARRLALCGLQSDHCVSNTALAALALGFDVVVADDAHGTWPSRDHSADAIAAQANARLQTAGMQLRSTRALVQAMLQAMLQARVQAPVQASTGAAPR